MNKHGCHLLSVSAAGWRKSAEILDSIVVSKAYGAHKELLTTTHMVLLVGSAVLGLNRTLPTSLRRRRKQATTSMSSHSLLHQQKILRPWDSARSKLGLVDDSSTFEEDNDELLRGTVRRQRLLLAASAPKKETEAHCTPRSVVSSLPVLYAPNRGRGFPQLYVRVKDFPSETHWMTFGVKPRTTSQWHTLAPRSNLPIEQNSKSLLQTWIREGD